MELNNDILNEVKDIKNEMIELNDMIDKKCLEIYNQNDDNENKILKYKLYMENIILEYHKTCKLLFVKNDNLTNNNLTNNNLTNNNLTNNKLAFNNLAINDID